MKYKINRKEFAIRLRLLRTGAGYSQTSAAEKCGMPPSSWNHYEAERRLPDLDAFKSIVAVLGAASAGILIGTDDVPVDPALTIHPTTESNP